MSDEPLPQSEIILYQTEDGRTRVQCRFENETLWLTQAQIAALFQTTPQNVTLHLKTIFSEGELSEAATCKDYLPVRYAKYRALLDASPRAVDSDFEKAAKDLKKLPTPKKSRKSKP